MGWTGNRGRREMAPTFLPAPEGRLEVERVTARTLVGAGFRAEPGDVFGKNNFSGRHDGKRPERFRARSGMKAVRVRSVKRNAQKKIKPFRASSDPLR